MKLSPPWTPVATTSPFNIVSLIFYTIFLDLRFTSHWTDYLFNLPPLKEGLCIPLSHISHLYIPHGSDAHRQLPLRVAFARYIYDPSANRPAIEAP